MQRSFSWFSGQAGRGYLLNDIYLANRVVNTASTRAGTVRINSAQEVELLPGFEVEVHISTDSFNPETIY